MAGQPVEYKSMDAWVNLQKLDQGILEGHIAIFGNVDLAEQKSLGIKGDRLWPGSFAKTIKEHAQGMPVVVDHEEDEDGNPFPSGVSLEMREVSREDLPPEILERAPEAQGGVYGRAQLAMTPRTRKFIREVKARGGVVPLSFKYRVIRAKVENGVRELYEIACDEWGPQWRRPPANPLAYAHVKSADDDGPTIVTKKPAPGDPYVDTETGLPGAVSLETPAASDDTQEKKAAPADEVHVAPEQPTPAEPVAEAVDHSGLLSELDLITAQLADLEIRLEHA